MPQEQLSIRIDGDSAPFRRELEQLLDRLAQLESRLQQISDSGKKVGKALSSVSQAIGPLTRVNQLLTQLSGQIRRIAQQPVTLNVQPALQSLQQLQQAAQATLAQIQALSAAAGGVQAPAPAPPAGPTPRVPGMSTGGLVTGPAGLDQVPRMLTAGEYVVQKETVQTLGIDFLDALNRRALPAAPRPNPRTLNTRLPNPASRSHPASTEQGEQSQPVTAASLAKSLRSLIHPLPTAADAPSSSAVPSAHSPDHPAIPLPNAPFPPRSASSDIVRRSHIPAPTHEAQVTSTHNTTNQYGGIEIHVQNQVDLESVIGSLERHTLYDRVRRG